MFQEIFLKLLAIVLGSGLGAAAYTKDFTDEQYALFPRLFHLDVYEDCLMKEEAVYCLGVFQLSAKGHNPTFDLMKEYSEDTYNFNHTYIHRGYCVSARCPSPSQSPLLRFARCVSRWGKQHGFNTRLHKLDYCITHREHVSEKRGVETPHKIFLWVLGVIALVNIIGTVHDMTTSSDKNIRVFTAWSVRNNWLHLVGPFAAGDPRLAALLPLEGGRVILMLLVILMHTGCIQYMVYLQNPRFVEQMSHHSIMMFLQNGSSAIQYFFLLSSFFLGQSMLREKDLSFRMFPKLLIKRIVRIAPVHLLVVGFAASWWPLARSGPQWTPLVGSESTACRNKFWSLAFFVGNFVRDDETCLIQTWFIGVDMQLYIMSGILNLLLARVRRWALHILASMFVATCAVNTWLAYSYEWMPLMLLAGPETIRTMFSSVDSFRMFYTKPWSSLPASLVGLFMAHLLLQIKNTFNSNDHKTLIILCQLCLPLLPMWAGGGNLFRGVSGWSAAVYLAMESPIMCLLSAPLMFGVLCGNGGKIGFLYHLFSWRIWYPMGRMSLAAMMLHWGVNMTLAASTPGLLNSTTLDVTVYYLATVVFTYLLAVPVTLLLEIPMQQLFKVSS